MSTENKPENPSVTGGMTLCDYFAGKALTALVDKHYGDTVEDLARKAYQMGRAMLAEREKS